MPSPLPGLLRALRAPGRLRRFGIFAVCIVFAAWTWRDASAGGYAGLPVNTLGQVLGDLLLMGLVAPLASLYRTGRPRHSGHGGKPMGNSVLLEALGCARHRIQLLDVRVCLAQIASAPPGRAPSTAASDERRLAQALRRALDNDVCVEILLFDPDDPSSREAARYLGFEPESYRRLLRAFRDELAALPGPAHPGRLDLRFFSGPPAVSFVRCDVRIWASLHLEGVPATTGYLALDQEGENARALQAYFNGAYATARPAARTGPAAEVRAR